LSLASDSARRLDEAVEAAAMLRIAEPELVRAAERGELPGRRIGDEWRFGREALLAWLSG
jgi:excisionase family DNA binding protein